MLDALNTAKNGLLQAERRATDIAKEILQSTRSSPSFSDTLETKQQESQTAPAEAQAEHSQTGAADYGSLIQQFSDLRAEENAFKANATAFKRSDETLGSLLDDKG